jgi:hypothetical protein
MAKTKNPTDSKTPVVVNSMTDLFTSAPVKEVKKEVSKSKSKVKDEVDMPEIDELAAFNILTSALKQESEGLEARVKEEVLNTFTAIALESKKRPETFSGKGTFATGNCVLKKNGRAKISEEFYGDMVEKGFGDMFDKKVKTEAMLVLNTELPQEAIQRFAEIVLPLLQKDKILSQYQIVLQRPEEYEYVVSDSALDILSKNSDEETFKSVFEKIASISLGPYKIQGDDTKEKGITNYAKQKAIEILMSKGVLPELEAPPKKSKK